MAVFNFDNKQIYYEISGSGKPILILNGIMMSTKSWDPFMPSLLKNNTVIRLDFLDQGQSDKMNDISYNQEIQVEVVDALLNHLNISKINLVGISYGGEVALLYATKKPAKIERMVLFNTTPYTSPWLQEIGHQWNSIGKLRDGQTYYQATIPVIYSPSFYEGRLDWMKKREALLIPIFSNPSFLDAMERLTNSAEYFDVRKDLHLIKSPVLVVAADEDYLTPIQNQKYLKKHLVNAELVILPGVGHASMYERPLLFTTLVLGFINAEQDTFQI
jgi:3-oxoadipate enol-lactonase